MTVVLLGVLQFLAYLAATVDIRAIALKKYGWAVLTNTSIPMLSYAMVVVIRDERTGLLGAIACGVGGAASAVLGIWLTNRWEHKP